MSEPVQLLIDLKKSLSKPRKLSELWQTYPMLWQDIQWQQAQLRLWLAALPGIQISQADTSDPVYQITGQEQGQDDLGDIIYDIVCKNNLPASLLHRITLMGYVACDIL